MGYAQTISGSYVKIASDTAGVTATTVAGSKLLGDITVPALKGNIKYAALDVVVTDAYNSNVAANWIVQTGLLQINSGGWRNANNPTPQPCLYTAASTHTTPNFTSYGYIDIKQYISSNHTYNCRFELVEAHLNNMELYVVCILNIYFE